ncbi:hypothetical protein [uncultured Fusobacterium sp.]|uniref:hypothetical protein n=1 Tax=uncultured Fusobacterium sp. TaxID=159267 RepID=UPI0025EA49A5|nr:hypothetical protein [uncultured Fusobacterium sp.]
MKKFICMLLLVVLGNFVYAVSEESVITVKATLVDEEFVVGGVNDKPLIIDFGNIGESSNGNLDFMVQYSGVKNNSSKVDMSLNNSEIVLSNENNSTLSSNVALNKKGGIIDNKALIASIKGDIAKNSITENGIYTGIVHLNVTVIPM